MTAREALSILKLQSISLKRIHNNLAFDDELEIIEKELNQLEEDKQNLTETNLELCKLNHKQAIIIGIVRTMVNEHPILLAVFREYVTQEKYDLLKEFL